MSRRVKRLERALGQRLFLRRARSVSLTEEGLTYFESARRALALLDDGRDALREQHSAPEGNVRITAPPDLADSVLVPLLRDFLQDNPAVSIDVVLSERLLDFDAHDIDLALRAVGSLPDSDLVAQKLSETEVRLFASPEYVSTRGIPSTPRDLAEHALLLHRHTGRRPVAIALSSPRTTERVTVAPRLCCMDFGLLRASALEGVGIAELPSMIVAEQVAAGVLVPVLPGYQLVTASLYLLSRKARFLPRRVRALRNFLAARLS